MTEQEAAVLAERRLSAYTRREGGCLVWTHSTCGRGYGKIHVARRRYMTHRLAWILHNGRSIPKGMEVMHSCDHPPCCDPAHLSLGTRSDNARDAVRKGRYRSYGAGLNRTHCRNGHLFDKVNTYHHPSGSRVCRKCLAVSQKQYKQRKKAKV